ncbi:protein FMC1 homolog isoform X1 [Symphalangus syndactylus]|uniref:protein FMC1 homolog isoform X1 n=1 Tax=Symphalangus syndactylus TaxID=9590 RepID=UPI003007E569
MAALGSPAHTFRGLLRELRYLSAATGRPYRDTAAYRSPVKSCAEPNMSFISKLPPISASCVASGNMWPYIRNFMARVSAQWRSLLAWWVSSCPVSLEGRAGSHEHGEYPRMLHS